MERDDKLNQQSDTTNDVKGTNDVSYDEPNVILRVNNDGSVTSINSKK